MKHEEYVKGMKTADNLLFAMSICVEDEDLYEFYLHITCTDIWISLMFNLSY